MKALVPTTPNELPMRLSDAIQGISEKQAGTLAKQLKAISESVDPDAYRKFKSR